MNVCQTWNLECDFISCGEFDPSQYIYEQINAVMLKYDFMVLSDILLTLVLFMYRHWICCLCVVMSSYNSAMGLSWDATNGSTTNVMLACTFENIFLSCAEPSIWPKPSCGYVMAVALYSFFSFFLRKWTSFCRHSLISHHLQAELDHIDKSISLGSHQIVDVNYCFYKSSTKATIIYYIQRFIHIFVLSPTLRHYVKECISKQ